MPLGLALSNLLSGGIGAIGQGIQSLIGSQQQRYNVNKTNEANRKMAEYTYSKDLEMWNKMNEYNLPSSQMARLKQAGLNPNLVYGSGGATTQAAQMPKYNAPTQSFSYTPAVDIPSMIGMFQDIQIKNAQIDNLKAQKEATEKSTFLKDIQGKYMPEFLKARNFKEGQSGYWQDLISQQKELQERAKANVMRKDAWGEYTLEAMKGKNRNLEAMYDKFMAEISRANAGTDYTRTMTDWYASKTIADMMSKIGGTAKGFLPQFNQKGFGKATKYFPQYNRVK